MQRIVYLLHPSIYGIFFYSRVWLSKKFKGDKAYDMWWKDYNYKKREKSYTRAICRAVKCIKIICFKVGKWNIISRYWKINQNYIYLSFAPLFGFMMGIYEIYHQKQTINNSKMIKLSIVGIIISLALTVTMIIGFVFQL
mgnify:CR=1 FL=1